MISGFDVLCTELEPRHKVNNQLEKIMKTLNLFGSGFFIFHHGDKQALQPL
jgi:hypothetical protein